MSDGQAESPIPDFSEAEEQLLQQSLRSIPPIKSYSMAKRMLHAFLGPLGRIWRREHGGVQAIEMGYQKGGTRYVLGVGTTYEAALKQSALTLAHSIAKLREAARAQAAQGASPDGVGGGPAPVPAGPDPA